ncbi:MAG TPA: hypothetical protein VLZ74_13955, partial [Methylocella sp.]|nr:hypothetical protein [Methylocella sp.]
LPLRGSDRKTNRVMNVPAGPELTLVNVIGREAIEPAAKNTAIKDGGSFRLLCLYAFARRAIAIFVFERTGKSF